MMARPPKRRFTDQFKRKAVALWETSGRLRSEGAAEFGIVPAMLRRWQRKRQESSASPANPAAKSASIADRVASDQAPQIARLRSDLERARMERDIKKSRWPLRADTAVTFAFVEQHVSNRPVHVLCRMARRVAHRLS